MNTGEILGSLMTCPSTKRYTAGVFAADELPRVIKSYPATLICNSDVISEPGSHWLAMYLPGKNIPGEFFDSYGRCPGYYSPYFVDFLKKNCSRGWIYNTKTVQAPFSLTCGAHCLFYVKLRCNGVKMADIVNSYYTPNVYENDIRVTINTHVIRCKPYTDYVNSCAKMQRCIPIVQ